MKSKIFTAMAAAGLAFNAAAIEFQTAAPSLGDVAQDNASMNLRVIVHANPGEFEAMKSTLTAHGATFHSEKDDWVSVSINVNENNYTELQNLGSVSFVEIDQKRVSVPNAIQSLSAEEFATLAEGDLYRWVGNEAVPFGIDAVQAYDFAPNAAYMPKVCVIDTGYNLGHPDLPTNVDGTDDGAGDWNIDGHGHGSHVAGTIAALGGNDQGVVGVIANSADLYITRVFDNSGGFVYASDLVGAIEDCADAGAKVVSMSLGGILSTKAEAKSIKKLAKKDVLMIAAAGNDGNATHSYPASYKGVVSIAATDVYNEQASFSQRTAQVQLSGPGVEVASTVPGGYALMSGTSMATPHVSGVAALVWSHFPECSAYDIVHALEITALDLDEVGYDYKTGHGLVQAQDAYAYLTDKGCHRRDHGHRHDHNHGH